MVSLYDIIQYLYPNAAPEMNVTVRNEQIVLWGLAVPRPTPAEIDAARLPVLKNSKRLEMRRAAFQEQDTLLAPGYEDRDYIHVILAALQRNPDPRQGALMTIKQKLDTKLSAVDAATTQADVSVITW